MQLVELSLHTAAILSFESIREKGKSINRSSNQTKKSEIIHIISFFEERQQEINFSKLFFTLAKHHGCKLII